MRRGHLCRIGGVAEEFYLQRVPPEISIHNYVIHREVRESWVCDFGKARSTGVRTLAFVTLSLTLGHGFSNENSGYHQDCDTWRLRPQILFCSSPPQEPVQTYLTFTDVAAPLRAPVGPARVALQFHQPFEKTRTCS